MKVLFVSSGNTKSFDIAPFIKVQGESLRSKEIDVEYFRVTGKGIFGYLSNVKPLKKILSNSKFDVIHAHFTLSAWVAVLSFTETPIVLSLMGTDAYGRVDKLKKNRIHFNYFTLLTLLIQPFVRKIISKSPNIERFVWQKRKSYLLPNGVDITKFYPSRDNFRLKLGMDPKKMYLLFLGNTHDPRKNYQLILDAQKQLDLIGIEVISPYPIPHQKVFEYLNSVDVLVMCSFEEGSPNVVKEGMACNCKGVFTDVGDVRYLVEGVEGYEIADFDSLDLVDKIIKVISKDQCRGRERLLELKLDLPMVAENLIKIYSDSIK
jgi:glycosyltransferase involved in cell wall biosynthesis